MDWPNSKRIPQHCGLNTRKLFIYSKHSWPTTDCFHSRGQQLNKFLGTNVKFLHQTKVQATKDFFGTPTWPPFHCFVHQYGRRNVIWKRYTFKFVLSEFWTIQRRRRIPPIRAQFYLPFSHCLPTKSFKQWHSYPVHVASQDPSFAQELGPQFSSFLQLGRGRLKTPFFSPLSNVINRPLMKTVLEHPLNVRNSLFKAIPRSVNWRDPICNVFPRCVMVWNPLGGTSVVRNESTAIDKLPEVTFTSSLCHLPSARFWPMTALVLSKKDFTYAAWRRPFSKAKPKKDWKLKKRSFKFALLYFVIIVRIDYRKNWLISVKKIFISIQKETRVVQWWQQSPPTNVACVWILEAMP